MNKILEIKNLSKENILLNINLEIYLGKIIGLLGKNGSGKTTLLNIIANMSRQDRGDIYVDKLKVSTETMKIVSYLPDKLYFPKHLKISSMLKIYKDFFEDFNLKKSKFLLEKLNLKEDRYIYTLSKGELEKFGFILTISREAKLYILDEPLASVDIETREEILKIIAANIDENKSIIIATHLISDIENIFDEIIILNNKLIEHSNVDKIRETHNVSILEYYKKGANNNEIY